MKLQFLFHDPLAESDSFPEVATTAQVEPKATAQVELKRTAQVEQLTSRTLNTKQLKIAKAKVLRRKNNHLNHTFIFGGNPAVCFFGVTSMK